MPAVRGDGMRGLAVFISDIRFHFWLSWKVATPWEIWEEHVQDLKLSLLRNCKSKEAEVKRINKELANIRSKFKVSMPIAYAQDVLPWLLCKMILWCTDVDCQLNFCDPGWQDVGWLPEEEICLQTAFHLLARPRHWLWPDGSSQPALIKQVHWETNCKYLRNTSCKVLRKTLWKYTIENALL